MLQVILSSTEQFSILKLFHHTCICVMALLWFQQMPRQNVYVVLSDYDIVSSDKAVNCPLPSHLGQLSLAIPSWLGAMSIS